MIAGLTWEWNYCHWWALLPGFVISFVLEWYREKREFEDILKDW